MVNKSISRRKRVVRSQNLKRILYLYVHTFRIWRCNSHQYSHKHDWRQKRRFEQAFLETRCTAEAVLSIQISRQYKRSTDSHV